MKKKSTSDRLKGHERLSMKRQGKARMRRREESDNPMKPIMFRRRQISLSVDAQIVPDSRYLDRVQ